MSAIPEQLFACPDGLSVAAVVVTFNRKELLRDCLHALVTQTRALDEIIVIDNAGTDGTEAEVRKTFPQITYTRLPKNVGGAGGFHEGLKLGYEKGHDWIWVMDDDTMADGDALHQLLSHPALNDKKTFALASTVLDTERRINAAHKYNFDPAVPCMRMINAEEYRNSESFVPDIATFVGMLVGRRAIQAVGLPIKEMFIYNDDAEYSLRMKKNGGQIVVVSKSCIVDRHPGNAPHSAAWRVYYRRRNDIYLFRKYGSVGMGFYKRLLRKLLRTQVEIIKSCGFRQALVNSKVMWLSALDGILGRLGKNMVPGRPSSEAPCDYIW